MQRIAFVMVLGASLVGCSGPPPPPPTNPDVPRSENPYMGTTPPPKSESPAPEPKEGAVNIDNNGVRIGAEGSGVKIDQNGFEVNAEDGTKVKIDKDGVVAKGPGVNVAITPREVTPKDFGIPFYGQPDKKKSGVRIFNDGQEFLVAEFSTKDEARQVLAFYKIEIVSPEHHKEGDKNMLKGKNSEGKQVEIETWPESGERKIRLQVKK